MSRNQKGYALLLPAIIILLGLTITGLIVSKTMFFNQKEHNNLFNQNLAFMAAEAGLEYGIAYLKNNKALVLTDANNNGYIDGFTNSSITNVAFTNNTKFSVSYANPVLNNNKNLQIMSTGSADNGTSTRVIRMQLEIYPLLATNPPASIVSHKGTNLSGNVHVENTQTGVTLWSGGNVALAGSANTKGTNNTTSNKQGLSSDVVRNDPGLGSLTGDNFFSGFFGRSKADIQQGSDIIYTNNSSANYSEVLNGISGKSVWINQTGGTAKLNSNSTIGTAEKPVILIVNGDFQANASITVYGLVYVIGNWDNTGGGNLTVTGSVVVEGIMSGNGTPNVTYSTNVLGNLTQIGEYVKVPGSWRDF